MAGAPAGHFGRFSLSFTVYIDAITHEGVTAEDRLPPETSNHWNVYQSEGWPADPSHGAAVSGAYFNDEADLDEPNDLFYYPNGITHWDLDNELAVYAVLWTEVVKYTNR